MHSDRNTDRVREGLVRGREVGLEQLDHDTNQPPVPPIWNIPPEILSEIFLQCLPEPEDSTPSTDVAPLLVSRICSYWRKVALSTPQLWSSICLSPHSHRSDIDYVHLLGSWLSRSGTCPLSIYMTPRCDARSYLEAVVPFAPRWTHLTLDCDITSFRPLRDVSGDSLFLLETLEILIYRVHTPLPEDLMLFNFAPRLRSFFLSILNFEFSINLSALPWKNVTDLTVLGGVPGQCLMALAECQKLEICRLSLRNATDLSGYPIITLPKLHTLTLYTCIVDVFLGRLRLPALRDLDIAHRKTTSLRQPNRNPLKEMVSRSGCQLGRLVVGLHSVIEEDLVGCLELSPELHTLKMEIPLNDDSTRHITDAFFDLLTYRPSNGVGAPKCLVPRLNKLVIKACHGISSQTIERMLNSRQTAHLVGEDFVRPDGLTPLEDVSIYARRGSSPSAAELWFMSEAGRAQMRHVDI